MSYTAFASYPQVGTIEAKSFDTAEACSAWLDLKHPKATASVRASTTSDGCVYVSRGLNYGRVVMQRERGTWIVG